MKATKYLFVDVRRCILREAVASATKALRIGVAGRTAEIDGAYFGGHVRPENLAAERIDRRLAENQSGQCQVVVAMCERGGRTLAQVFAAETDALAAVRPRIAKGTVVHADEALPGTRTAVLIVCGLGAVDGHCATTCRPPRRYVQSDFRL